MNYNYFWKVQRSMTRCRELTEKFIHPYCEQNGLTLRQLRVLMSLYFEGPMSASELARMSCMAGANLSSLCKRLVAKGLISRSRGVDDERLVLIRLTPKGEAMVDAFWQQHAPAGPPGSAILQMTETQAETILEGLGRLEHILQSGVCPGEKPTDKGEHT